MTTDQASVSEGYSPQILEKVRRLLDLLNNIQTHHVLKGRLALKGGTALNLFLWDTPRLSVDLDLNYLGTSDREEMLTERPRIEQALEAVCGRLGIAVRHMPRDHAGGKWRLTYTGDQGPPGTLEIDLNFLDRVRLWTPAEKDSHMVDGVQACGFPVLDLHELAAGKLAALLSRQASRDLFDVHRLLSEEGLDPARLRLVFLVYGGMNRKDWREVSVDGVSVTRREVETQLLPVLRGNAAPDRDEMDEWINSMVDGVKDGLSIVLPFTPDEREFLDGLNDRGEIFPELLTSDPGLQEILRTHPGLRWKAINVRKHAGLEGPEDAG